MWTFTRFSFVFFLLFLLQLNMKGQADAADHYGPCCCKSKTVGNYTYTFSKTGSGDPLCPKDCIYTRDNEGNDEYCFAPGIEPVTCNNRGYAQITNYCNGTANGAINIYRSDLTPKYNFTVGPDSTICVEPISDVETVTATITFQGGKILPCQYYGKSLFMNWAWKFSIACQDGGSEKCKVRAVE